MKKLLIRFLRWLLSKLEPSVFTKAFVLPPEVEALIPTAKEFIAQFAAREISGESKRHQVYALMIKACPAASKRDIGLAIEMAVRDAG